MSNPKKPFNKKAARKPAPRKPAAPRPGLILGGFIAATAALGGALFAVNRIDEHEKRKAEDRRRQEAQKPAPRAPGKGFKFHGFDKK